MVNEWIIQQELEKIFSLPDSTQSQRPDWWSKLRQFFSLWADPVREPQIYEEYDPETGNPYWRVYNPARDRWLELDSREAVLTWLEHYPYYR